MKNELQQANSNGKSNQYAYQNMAKKRAGKVFVGNPSVCLIAVRCSALHRI